MADNMVLRLLRTWQGAIGIAVLGVGMVLAFSAPILTSNDPLAIVGGPLILPLSDTGLPLGTDRLGRDLFAELLYGARTTLLIAFSVAFIALLIGALVGTIAGYFGGALDEIAMRITDAAQTVPSFVLALALVSVVGPSRDTLIAALAAGAWTVPARLTRAEILGLKTRPFVDASRLLGRPALAIAFQVVLPNSLNVLIALFAVIVGNAILLEAALSFLGLGDPNVASWGAMIAEGRSVMRTAPHVILLPGLAIVGTVLATSLLGEALTRVQSE